MIYSKLMHMRWLCVCARRNVMPTTCVAKHEKNGKCGAILVTLMSVCVCTNHRQEKENIKKTRDKCVNRCSAASAPTNDQRRIEWVECVYECVCLINERYWERQKNMICGSAGQWLVYVLMTSTRTAHRVDTCECVWELVAHLNV